MPFLTSVRRALPAVTLFATFALAQTCYYPSGSRSTSDTPCNSTATDSACCGANSFCLDGGLCFSGGVLTRGSCTDKTWGSSECSGYCKTITTSGDVGITPCNLGASENTFVCGLDSTQCTTSSKTFTLASDLSLVLRPDEVATLVGPALAAASAHPGSGWFSTGQLLGVALGIALPLLFALGILGYLFMRERRPKRKSMLKLPDDSNESRFSFQPPPVLGETLQHRASRASQATQASGRSNRSTTSRRPSLRSMNSNGSHRRDHPPRSPTIASPRPTLSPNVSSYHEPQRLHSYAESRPSQVPSFAERFEAMKVTPQLVDVRDSSQSRHELDSSPSTPREVERFELATARMSR